MPDSKAESNASQRESGSSQSGPESAERGAQAQNGNARQHGGRRRLVLLLAILLFVGLAVAAYFYWLGNRGYESTDDANIDGRAISIAPQVSGNVVSLDVNDNQFVHKGDPLIHIDNRQYVIDRESAQAQLATAKGQLAGFQYAAEVARKNFPAQLLLAQAQLAAAQAVEAKAEADDQRQKALPRQATSQQDIDAATAALRQAQAQVAQAEAQVQQAEPVPQRIGQAEAEVQQNNGQVAQAQARLDQALLNLSYTIVTAPQDGWITKRNVEVGNYVTPGQQIFSIVSPAIWVTANFKESQLRWMRRGQSVTISVDAYPELNLTGHVDSIQLGTGSKFTAFPPENATGNFVKIVQRVPVKIDVDSGLDPRRPMPLGLSVEPRVKVQ
jgi:membrane fusion protein (multidrug efflux system)